MKNKFLNLGNDVIVNQKNVLMAMAYQKKITVLYCSDASLHDYNHFYHSQKPAVVENTLKQMINDNELIKNHIFFSDVQVGGNKFSLYVNRKLSIAYFDFSSKPVIVTNNGLHIYLSNYIPTMTFAEAKTIVKKIAKLL